MKSHLVTALAACSVLAACSGATPTDQPPLATKPTVGQEIKAVAQNKLTVTFADGSDRLTPEAGKQLDVAARLFRDVDPVMMYSVGYSDSVGNEFDNVVLSAKRARAVKAALVARGIPADRLQIQAMGESEPIDSGDPKAAENRRVTVTWRVL